MGKFAADIEGIRRRARQHMERGAVTESYRANLEEVIQVLNEALATELVCILRYKRHYFMATGIDAQPVAAEFLQHAIEEQQHADEIAARITQLGGEPNFNPVGLAERSHAEYAEGETLIEMIEEDLVAERIAIESYSEMIRWLGGDDPTTRRMLEGILAMEEEHADDLANMLETLAANQRPRSKRAPAKRPAAKRAAGRKTAPPPGERGARRSRALKARVLGIMTLALALGAGAAPAADNAADKAADVMATGLTGAVGEEQFKAMHDLKSEKAPAPKGAMIDLAGGQAYLSLPAEAKAPLPGLIVIHEWWGLNDHIKHWADRLAAEGYAALAVDLYGGKVATTPDSAMAYMKAVDDARALAIMSAAHDYLQANAGIRAPRTGSIGWCFGGGMSLKLALAEPDLDAAVIYYGRLVTDPKALAAIKAPILGIFGNRDESIPPAVVNDFDAALSEAKVPHEIRRYDADHAFANPSAASYDQKNAGVAWAEVEKFLAAHLKGGDK